MPEVTGIEKLFSIWAKKKALRFNQFATSQFGHSWFGDEDYYIQRPPLPPILISGIYRTDNVTGETKNYRSPYYIVRDPKDPTVVANRQKFAEAMFAWQALTPEEKLVYYKRVKKMRMLGHNLFIREYLKSH